MRRALALLASLQLVFAASGFASERYDPRLRFRTIATPRFDIHFHQGQEQAALRLAAIAEAVAAELDQTLGPASGRVQVILVDQSDVSNGWATALPYNTIEIAAAAPRAESVIGNTTDWLRLVFVHEYTHVVHLSRGKGWIGGLRKVFGRMPLLYPNVFLPQWQIEGLATYQESAVTGEGRVRDGSFRSLIDVAAAHGGFLPLDRVNGGLVDWPGGNAPYLYGAYFHQYLRDRYGDKTLRALSDATAERVPYFGATAFREVYGRPLGVLWDEFAAAAVRDAPTFAPDVRRLTTVGFIVNAPRFAADGRIFYSASNPHGFPGLYAVSAAEGGSVRIADRFLGNSLGMTPQGLVFDQLEVVRQVGLESDLYSIDMRSGHRRRLTSLARAADPDVAADGAAVVFAVQKNDRRELATASLAADGRLVKPVTLVSEPGVNYAAPRWSRDGRAIAAERGPSTLVVIDAATRQVEVTIAAASKARLIAPAFMPDGRLLFAADAGGRGFQIYRTDLLTLETWRLDGTGPDARSPDVSPGGDTMVFVGETPAGRDLFLVALSSARWTAVGPGFLERVPRSTRPAEPSLDPSAAPVGAVYRPWRTLAPRFWTPTIESDGDDLVIGAATQAADALGRHVYAVSAGWSAARTRPDWTAAYVYDRWRPTLFVNASDDTDGWRDGDVRTQELNAGAQWPIRRVRWTQAVLGAVHSSVDRFECTQCPIGDVTRRAVRTGWSLDAWRGYGYSISREDGWSAITSVELAREELGSDGDAGAAVADVRGYVPIRPRHAVLALRAAGAATWGDARARRLFSASGSDPQPGGFRFGSDAIGLLRGVPEDEVLGTRAAVANLDVRLPIARIDRGAGTLPVFARVLHAAVFVDAGRAWEDDVPRPDWVVSTGIEASLDAVIGYTLPVTFATGVAWSSGGRGVTVFGRIGRAF